MPPRKKPRQPDFEMTWRLAELEMLGAPLPMTDEEQDFDLPFDITADFSDAVGEPGIIVCELEFAPSEDYPPGLPTIEACGLGDFGFDGQPVLDEPLRDRMARTLFGEMLEFTKPLANMFAPPGLAVGPRNRRLSPEGAELVSLTIYRVDFSTDDEVIEAHQESIVELKGFRTEFDIELLGDRIRGYHRMSLGGVGAPMRLEIKAESSWRFPSNSPRSAEWRQRFFDTFQPNVQKLLEPVANRILEVAGMGLIKD